MKKQPTCKELRTENAKLTVELAVARTWLSCYKVLLENALHALKTSERLKQMRVELKELGL